MTDALGRALHDLGGAHGSGHLVIRTRKVDQQLQYHELFDRASTVAAALLAMGIAPGDRVALLMNSSLDVVTAIVAVLRIGATLVPVYPFVRPQKRDSHRRSLLSALSAGKAKVLLLPLSQREDYATAISGVDLIALEALSQFEAAPPFPLTGQSSGGAPALIQFSSGSTGNPKGVVVSRAGLATCIDSVARRNNLSALSALSAVGSWLPLYHDFGLVGGLLQALLQGSPIWLMPPQDFVRDPLSWIRLLSDCSAAFTGAPNFAYQLCAEKLAILGAAEPSFSLSSLNLATNASEPVQESTVRDFQTAFARYGLPANVVQPTYGLAENCAAATMPHPQAPLTVFNASRRGLANGVFVEAADGDCNDGVRFPALGSPLDRTTIRVVDHEGREGRDIVGTIYVSGETSIDHFARADGAFEIAKGRYGVDSGDLGVLRDGQLFVVGRSKDMFKYGGRAFAPADLENVLAAKLNFSPQSIGVFSTNPDLAGADQVNVIFEMRDSKDVVGEFEQLTESIKSHIRNEFGIPITECIAIRRGQLPRTTSGKLRRAYLRQQHELKELDKVVEVINRQ